MRRCEWWMRIVYSLWCESSPSLRQLEQLRIHCRCQVACSWRWPSTFCQTLVKFWKRSIIIEAWAQLARKSFVRTNTFLLHHKYIFHVLNYLKIGGRSIIMKIGLWYSFAGLAFKCLFGLFLLLNMAKILDFC